jgi:hypothetical protein
VLSVRTTVLKTPCFVNRFSLLETIDSEPVPGDTIQNIQSPSITLRVTLVGKKSNQEISARTLLDSGAEGIIIDQDFAMGNKLTLRNLVHPLPVKNVDRTPNKRGSIKYTTILKKLQSSMSRLWQTTILSLEQIGYEPTTQRSIGCSLKSPSPGALRNAHYHRHP